MLDLFHLANPQKKRGQTEVSPWLAVVFCSLALAVLSAPPTRAEQIKQLENEPSRSILTATEFGSVEIKMRDLSTSLDSAQPFALTVELDVPEKLTLEPNEVEGEYGDFDLLPLEDAVKPISNSRKRIERSWSARPIRRGRIELPPIPFLLTANVDNTVTTIDIQTNPVIFDIPETETQGSIKDIVYDLTPIRRSPIGVIVVCFLGLVFLALISIFVGCSSAAKSAPSPRTEEDPYAKALRRLRELKQSRLYLENEKEFYEEIADVLRVYLSERFSLNSKESTTKELLATIDSFVVPKTPDALSQGPLGDASKTLEQNDKTTSAFPLQNAEIREKIATILNAVDLVKFANQTTSFDNAERLLKDVCFVVDKLEQDLEALMNSSSPNESSPQLTLETQ